MTTDTKTMPLAWQQVYPPSPEEELFTFLVSEQLTT